jgi:hypothetical protein
VIKIRFALIFCAHQIRQELQSLSSKFTKLTRRRLKRGVFQSIKDLKAAINRFVAETNAKPEPSGPPIHAASSPL